MNALEQHNIVVGADIDGYTRAMQDGYRETTRFQRAVGELGASIESLQQKAQRRFDLISAATTAGITSAAAAATTLNDQMAQLESRSRMTGTGVNEAAKAVSNLRREYGMASDAAVQLITRMNTLGNMSPQRAAQQTSSYVGLSGMTGESISGLMTGQTQLARTMGMGRLPASIAPYSSMTGVLSQTHGTSAIGVLGQANQLAPVARSAGMSAPTVMGLSTAFSRSGADGDRSGAALNQLIADAENARRHGGPALRQFSSFMGVSSDQFRNMGATNQAVNMFERIGSGGQGAARFLDSLGYDGARTQQAVQSTLNTGDVRSTIQEAHGLARDDSQFQKAASDSLDTLTQSVARNNEVFKELGQALGSVFVPALKGAADGLNLLLAPVKLLTDGLNAVGDGPKRAVTSMATGATVAVGLGVPMAKLGLTASGAQGLLQGATAHGIRMGLDPDRDLNPDQEMLLQGRGLAGQQRFFRGGATAGRRLRGLLGRPGPTTERGIDQDEQLDATLRGRSHRSKSEDNPVNKAEASASSTSTQAKEEAADKGKRHQRIKEDAEKRVEAEDQVRSRKRSFFGLRRTSPVVSEIEEEVEGQEPRRGRRALNRVTSFGVRTSREMAEPATHPDTHLSRRAARALGEMDSYEGDPNRSPVRMIAGDARRMVTPQIQATGRAGLDLATGAERAAGRGSAQLLNGLGVTPLMLGIGVAGAAAGYLRQESQETDAQMDWIREGSSEFSQGQLYRDALGEATQAVKGFADAVLESRDAVASISDRDGYELSEDERMLARGNAAYQMPGSIFASLDREDKRAREQVQAALLTAIAPDDSVAQRRTMLMDLEAHDLGQFYDDALRVIEERERYFQEHQGAYPVLPDFSANFGTPELTQAALRQVNAMGEQIVRTQGAGAAASWREMELGRAVEAFETTDRFLPWARERETQQQMEYLTTLTGATLDDDDQKVRDALASFIASPGRRSRRGIGFATHGTRYSGVLTEGQNTDEMVEAFLNTLFEKSMEEIEKSEFDSSRMNIPSQFMSFLDEAMMIYLGDYGMTSFDERNPDRSRPRMRTQFGQAIVGEGLTGSGQTAAMRYFSEGRDSEAMRVGAMRQISEDMFASTPGAASGRHGIAIGDVLRSISSGVSSDPELKAMGAGVIQFMEQRQQLGDQLAGRGDIISTSRRAIEDYERARVNFEANPESDDAAQYFQEKEQQYVDTLAGIDSFARGIWQQIRSMEISEEFTRSNLEWGHQQASHVRGIQIGWQRSDFQRQRGWQQEDFTRARGYQAEDFARGQGYQREDFALSRARAEEDYQRSRGYQMEDFYRQMEYREFDFNLSRSRAFEDFNRSRGYQEEDYYRSRFRAEEDFGIQRARQERNWNRDRSRQMEDFNRSRAREEEDWNYRLERMAERSASNIYNIYDRISVARTWSIEGLVMNMADQQEALDNQVRHLQQLREWGVSDQAIQVLGLSDTNMAQQLERFVSEMGSGGTSAEDLNRMIGQRVSTAGELLMDPGSAEWQDMVHQRELALKRQLEDFEMSRDRAETDYKQAIQDMIEDFDRGMSRQHEDYVRNRARQLEEFNRSMERQFDDYKRSNERAMEEFHRSRERMEEEFRRSLSRQLEDFERNNDRVIEEYVRQRQRHLEEFERNNRRVEIQFEESIQRSNEMFQLQYDQQHANMLRNFDQSRTALSKQLEIIQLDTEEVFDVLMDNVEGNAARQLRTVKGIYDEIRAAVKGIGDAVGATLSTLELSDPVNWSSGVAGREHDPALNKRGGPEHFSDSGMADLLGSKNLDIVGGGGSEMPKHGAITQGYSTAHPGVDIAGSTGEPIKAHADGVVTYSGNAGAYGTLTKVAHGGGFETWYAHQSISGVHEGDAVGAGDVIGRVGATGNVYPKGEGGAHLHWEMRLNGRPVDPGTAAQSSGGIGGPNIDKAIEKLRKDPSWGKYDDAVHQSKALGDKIPRGATRDLWDKRIREEYEKKLIEEMMAGFGGFYADGATVRPVTQSHSGWNGGRYRSSGRWHGGLDFPAPTGTPVRAAWSGRVDQVRHLTTSYGKHVWLNHGAGKRSLYAHLSRTLVNQGQDVLAGHVIGQVGSTGNSTGPHLHWEVRVNGKQVDPTQYLSGAVTPGNSKFSSNVERWRPTVIQALNHVNQPSAFADITLRRLNQESSGNPRAINLWDSNARRGTPSKGLMQVIDPTFRAYRDRSLVNDIWDPFANIVASMRYAVGRYGNLPKAYNRPGGYAGGTSSATPGEHPVGEHGVELIIGKGLKRFLGGEKVLNPLQTRQAFNKGLQGTPAPQTTGGSGCQHYDHSMKVERVTVQANNPDQFRIAMEDRARMSALSGGRAR